MPLVRIILLAVAAAVLYGIVHDQITVRVCPEYLCVTHPTIITSKNPTLIALAWGVVATWWTGVLLGLPLALAARLGSPPRVSSRELLVPIALLLAGMGVIAVLAGLAGYGLSSRGTITIPPEVARVVPEPQHHRWMAAWWTHNASYNAGFVGTVVLIIRTLWFRRSASTSRTPRSPTTPPPARPPSPPAAA